MKESYLRFFKPKQCFKKTENLNQQKPDGIGKIKGSVKNSEDLSRSPLGRKLDSIINSKKE